MGSFQRPRIARGLTLATVAGLVAMTGTVVTAGTASAGSTASASSTASAGSTASASSTVTVKYKVHGTTFLKAIDATAKLGPGSLTSALNLKRGKLSAVLALPAATVSFKELNLIPVTATTKFVQDGKTTGKINLSTGAVKTTSKVTLQLTSLTVGGIGIPLPRHCESKSPAVIKLASQKGWSVLKGGKLAGTYTIPDFAKCGLVTGLLNLLIPGPGNTITLRLGAAKQVG